LPGGPKTGSKPGLAVKAADRHEPQGANGPVSGGSAETGKARKRARPEARKAALFWLARTESQSLPAACHASASQEKGRGKALAAFISLL